jgi:thiol-disulfide isomerase/thioredoxin
MVARRYAADMPTTSLTSLATLLVFASFGAAVAVPCATSLAATVAVDSSMAASADEFPEEWFWRMGKAGAAHRAMTGKPAPELKVKGGESGWTIIGEETPELAATLKELNAEGGDIDALKGKVVVVDFWATWCGPCRAALPKNVEMMKELGPKGLVVLGIHDAARGSDKMNDIAKGASLNYPLAIDDGGRSAAEWKVGFWPTYGVIDRKGILRAIGLQPQHVRAVAEKLLAEDAPETKTKRSTEKATEKSAEKSADDPAGNATKRSSQNNASAASAKNPRPEPVPAIYLEGDARKRARLANFDLCPESPALGAMTQWNNTESLGEGRSLAEFKGKIVVLDFWATWCGPCIQSIPKNNEIAKEYADDGVVLIGVCHKDGGEKMVETIRSKKIEYPCVLDAKGEANAAFKVDGYPDYVIIDREGRVRGADVQNGQVQNAIEYLLHQEKKQREQQGEKPQG